jgi:uncharacterized RDD family membrane protein YckC
MNEIQTDDDPLFPEADIKMATFWPRLGALILDGIIVSIIVLPVTYLNITRWKIPSLYIFTSLISIPYKPFMEYRYGATLGKMALGLKVVGHQFGKVTLMEELKRVSFYLAPGALIALLELRNYFSQDFYSITGYREFNRYVESANPAVIWINIIVGALLIADCITFFSNDQRRSLHDIYGGTYVIEKDGANN